MTLTDEIAEISRQLEAAGLFVAPPWGPYLGDADLVIFFGREHDPITHITTYADRCTIAYRGEQWHFCVWDAVPGPGPETLDYPVATRDEIITITLQFFLGEPQPIDGWLAPIHRHPEWDGQRLRHAIAHAELLTGAAIEQIQAYTHEHHERLFVASHPRLTKQPRTVAWGEWYTCLFVRLAPVDPALNETLWVRRDLQKAYIFPGKKTFFLQK